MKAVSRYFGLGKHKKKASAKKLGLLPPQAYMKEELDKLYKVYDVVQVPAKEGDWSEEHVKYLVDFCKKKGVHSVVGFAQKDAWFHALINTGLGHVSISPHAYLIAMNKYMQRTIEKKPFFFAPISPDEATNEELAALVPENEWPFMLKNTSLSLGRGVFMIKTKEEMFEILDEYRSNEQLRKEIANTNDAITSRMSAEEKAGLGPVPPFIAEHRVDLSRGWVEYCYEGCVDAEGNNTHYGMTEEVYFEDHQSLAYVTPPVSYPHEFIPELEGYVGGYMEGLIAKGYLKQFYNIEFWATFNTPDGKPEYAFCEINPRCAHTYHFGYLFAYDTNLYRDNWDLVLENKSPELTPWIEWKEGSNKYCTEILLTAKQEGKVGDILDYKYIDKIEKSGEVKLIRHIKDRNYVLNADDAKSGAGCTMLQIWIVTDTPQEAAKREMEIRKAAYKEDLGWTYPKIWTDLAV